MFSFLILLALPMTKADGQSREEAVRAAREGRTDEAIRDLQSIVHSREMIQGREWLGRRYAELVYSGLWFHDLRRSLQARSR